MGSEEYYFTYAESPRSITDEYNHEDASYQSQDNEQLEDDMNNDTFAESAKSILDEYNHEDELYQSQNKVHEQLEDDIYDGIYEDDTYEIEIAVNDQFEDDMNDDTFAESPDNTSDKFNHKDKSNQSQNSALKQL